MMRGKRYFAVALSTFFYSVTLVASEDVQTLAQRVQGALAPQFGAKGNAGAIVGIYDQGRIQFLSFGEVRRGSRVSPNEHTIFEIGSLTKTFTGLLLATAIENGEHKETDRLDSFVPEWKGQKTADITLLDLVTHRSGLPRLPCNLHYADPQEPYLDYTQKDLILGMRDDSGYWSKDCALGNHPSAAVNYSNWGFAVLGFVLSSEKQLDYQGLLAQRISRPLGLTSTTYELSFLQRLRTAQGYNQHGEPVPLWNRKVMMGNGAIRSTASDLIKYAAAFLHPEKTSLSSALNRSKGLHYDDGSQKIGYGWMKLSDGNIWHNGSTGGFMSMMKIYLNQDRAVFYLTNTAKELKCFLEAVESVPCKV